MSLPIEELVSRADWAKHCLEKTKGRTWYKAKYSLNDVRRGRALDKSRTLAQVREIAMYYRAHNLVAGKMLPPEKLLLLATTIGDITYFEEANKHLITNLAEWLRDKDNIRRLPQSNLPTEAYSMEQQITDTLGLQATVISVAMLEFCNRIPSRPSLALDPPGSASIGKSHEGSLRKVYLDDEIIDLSKPDGHLTRALSALTLGVGLSEFQAPRKIVVALIERRISELREEMADLRKRYEDAVLDLSV